jgi:hypothetical protein
MSAVSLDTDNSSVSNDFEFNYISGYVPKLSACWGRENLTTEVDDELFDGVEPYADELLADEWTRQYEIRQAEKQKRLQGLNNRLAGTETVDN